MSRPAPRIRAGLFGAALGAAVLAAPVTGVAAVDRATLVDTRDGSLGPGFPMVGASVPFGMIQPGPDTSLANGQQDPVDYDGYSYQDPDIRGFSLTHFDGAGIHIAGDLPFMPTTGAMSASDPAADASPYDHASEIAQPGYYAVTLARYQTRAELTGATRAALMRFTFPRTTQANVLAEVSQSINNVDPGSVTVVGDHTLEGWVRSDVGYKLYFAATFDRPFTAHGTWSGATLSSGSGQASGSPVGAYVTFDTTQDPTVTMRAAISYVDQAGAAGNLAAELPPHRSFEQVRVGALASWDRHLSDVALTGGQVGKRRTFYDNLYRALLMPSIFDDADGRYLGFDGVVHRVVRDHHHYTALSLWDTYRTEMPLLELIEPAVAHDVLVSLLDDADQNKGVIPRWVQANIDRGIMGGDSGSAVLADGAIAGLLNPSDVQRAIGDLLHQATTLPPVWPREHLDAYLNYGYVPYDVDGIGASLTLEYAIDDDAVAQLAKALGDGADAGALHTRADNWRNLVDPQDHFIRPRNSDGSWANPTTVGDPTGITGLSAPVSLPYSQNFQDGYQEGTGWQYLWAVPHDVAGLAHAIGGPPVLLRRLDRFFSTALNQPLAPAVPLAQEYTSFFGVYYIGGQYTPVNEPDLWAPWYYDWLGQPWKTQKVVRAEMAAYNPRPDGMPGNDDTGEMSAWYVLAALGLYHVAPGVDAWELSTPAFPRMVLPAGSHRIVIQAPGASALRPYVHAVRLDGKPLARTFLSSCELRAGGVLAFDLGASADREWGIGPGAAPPSASVAAADVDQCARRLAASGASG
jgi:predicted alpha-1,2-mannosidase